MLRSRALATALMGKAPSKRRFAERRPCRNTKAAIKRSPQNVAEEPYIDIGAGTPIRDSHSRISWLRPFGAHLRGNVAHTQKHYKTVHISCLLVIDTTRITTYKHKPLSMVQKESLVFVVTLPASSRRRSTC